MLMVVQRAIGKLREGRALSVASTMGVRGSSAGVQFVLNVVLGNLLGAAGLGVYFIYVSWLQLAGALASFGLPTLTLRTTAGYMAQGDVVAARRFWARSLLIAGGLSSALALAAFLLRVPLARLFFGDPALGYVVALVAFSAIPFELLYISAEVLKVQGRANLALGLQFTLLPVFLLAAVWGLQWLERPAPTPTVMMVHAGLLVVSTVLAVGAVRQGFRRGVNLGQAHPKAEAAGAWGARAVRFWLNNVLVQLNMQAPFVLLPLFVAQQEIGRYGVAHRLIALAGLLLIAISSVYAPLFARAYTRGDYMTLKALLKQTQLYSVVSFLPFLLLFVWQSEFILRLFGTGFAGARPVLFVLAVGQLVNSATGLVQYFNFMTDREGFELKVGGVALTLTVVAAALLAPRYGATGVAAAVATTAALKNLASYARAQYTLRQGVA